MEFLVYIVFLLIGYALRILGEWSGEVNHPSKVDNIKIPNIVEHHREKLIEKHQREEEERKNRETAIMLENIDNYDGTSHNQQDV